MDYGYNNNQYTTSYGAQGGNDGGGFVGGEAQSSQPGGKGYGKDTVRPVTIKQLLDAQHPHPDAEFKIDNDYVTQVTFVGQIRNISPQTTNITYTVDDGTGIMEVKQWIDSEASNDNMDTDSKPKLIEDGYCRVWGRLKEFNQKRHIGSHVIRPISDLNEIHYHLLEATAIHLFLTRGPPNENATGGNKGSTTNANQDYSSNPTAGMSAMARKVYETLKNSPASNEGLHVQMLASQMGLPVNEVYKGGEELLAASIIFPTVDDNTWALLDG